MVIVGFIAMHWSPFFSTYKDGGRGQNGSPQAKKAKGRTKGDPTFVPALSWAGATLGHGIFDG